MTDQEQGGGGVSRVVVLNPLFKLALYGGAGLAGLHLWGAHQRGKLLKRVGTARLRQMSPTQQALELARVRGRVKEKYVKGLLAKLR